MAFSDLLLLPRCRVVSTPLSRLPTWKEARVYLSGSRAAGAAAAVVRSSSQSYRQGHLSSLPFLSFCRLPVGYLPPATTTPPSPPLAPSCWQQHLGSRRGLMEVRPRCSQLPRLSRIYKMGAQEVLDCMRFCAGRRLLMRSAWEAFMYRCCALRGVFSVHQQVQVVRVFASIRRREWAFLNYILEGIRMQLQLLRLADAVLLLAALQRLRLRDELLLTALTPLCTKRIQITTTPPLVALLAHAAVRAGAPQLQQLLQQIYVCMASRMQQQQQPQTLSLLLAAYASYACKALGAPLLGAQHEAVSVSSFEGGGDDVTPFKPFIQLLLEAAGNPKTLKQARATDCMQLCIAAVNLQTVAAAAGGEGLVSSAFKEALLRRVSDLIFEFSPWELAHLLPALVHLPAGLPQQQQQQQQQQQEHERGNGALLLRRLVGLVLNEMAARAESFNAETAAIALKALETLPTPAPFTEAALLVRLSHTLSRPLRAGVSRHLHVLQQVAHRAALPSTLSLQPFLPALLPSSSSSSSSGSYDERTPYRLPCSSAVGVTYVAAIKAKDISTQVASSVSCLLALLQLRDARWAFTLMRLSPQLARSSNAASALSLSRLTLSLAMLSMPKVADELALFPLLSSRTQWPSAHGPLAILQAAALFDLTFKPRSLTPDMVLPAAKAFYLMREESATAELLQPAVMGLLSSSCLLTSLPSPLGAFLRSFASLPPPPLPLEGARDSALDVRDRIAAFGNKTNNSFKERGPPSAGALSQREGEGREREGLEAAATAPIQKRIEAFLKQLDEVRVHSKLCIGSWVYVDLAVDLQSLAEHMQNEGRRIEAPQQLAENETLESRGPPETEEELGAPLNTHSHRVPQTGEVVSEAEGTQVLATDVELGETTQPKYATYTGGPQQAFKDLGDCQQAAAAAAAATAAGSSPGPPPPSPPCYSFGPSGAPRCFSAVSPSTHLLVFILLESFDFFATPSNLQKLGIHRKKEALLSPATRARLSAVRQWGWPVVCVREKEWREAEVLDRRYTREGGPPFSDTHRKQLVLRLVASLATKGEAEDTQEV
ncbi:hypothetical protein Esti_001518 [Eimeria stiedai]